MEDASLFCNENHKQTFPLAVLKGSGYADPPTRPVSVSLDNPSTKKKARYSHRQWTVFGVLCLVNFITGTCFSLQAPFFPKEAAKKGVSASVYGFVFGIYELVVFIACPIYGKFIQKIGPKLMLNVGNFVMGSCILLFGFLNRAPPGTPFVVLAFSIRIVEALGQAGYETAIYAIVAKEFTDSIGTTFSILETLFGVGMIVGPTIGGLLYELGGYSLPFIVIGTILLIASVIHIIILPKIEDPKPRSVSFVRLLKIPSVLISYFAVTAVSFSYGFTTALLEPHISQFGLKPSLEGLVFIINGGVYALTAIIWGYLAEKKLHPKVLCGTGGVFIATAFLVMGPAPFFPAQPTLGLVIAGLFLQGMGTGGEFIAAFLDSTNEALCHGFPDNIETYGLISGLWASGLALGSFLGPTISGLLCDSVGFRNTSLVVFALHLTVAILNFGFLAFKRFRNSTHHHILSKNNVPRTKTETSNM